MFLYLGSRERAEYWHQFANWMQIKSFKSIFWLMPQQYYSMPITFKWILITPEYFCGFQSGSKPKNCYTNYNVAKFIDFYVES